MSFRGARLTLFALAAVLRAADSGALADPLHFWKQESGYAGSPACASCHSDIARSQSASHHAMSLRRASDVPELRPASPFVSDDSGRHTRLELHVAAGGY